MTVTDFILARLGEDEAVARDASPGPWHLNAECDEVEAVDDIVVCQAFALSSSQTRATAAHIARHDPARVLAQCAALREVVELHKSWPVLAQTEPVIEQDGGDLDSMRYRMTQQVQWLTEQEYREKFGTEPPTAPILRALAAIWADHPDYDEGWAS